MDDTVVKKTGKKIPATSWRRDPLGPPFHTNFIWGQRFIQLSLVIPDGQHPYQSRSIPIGFTIAPQQRNPSKQPLWNKYRPTRKRKNNHG